MFYENVGLYVFSLIMNRGKKRISGCIGRKERKMDWGYEEDVCSFYLFIKR